MNPFDSILPRELKGGLTQAEGKILQTLPSGEVCDLRSGDPQRDDPVQWSTWGSERTVRASFLRWLCTNPEAERFIHAKGIRIQGVRIEGLLDFEGATLLHRLFLLNSALPDGVALEDARTRTLSFEGSHLKFFRGDRLIVEGALILDRNFVKEGVKLEYARVEGKLSCTGGKFENPDGNALNADSLSVKGEVFLGEGFEAKGEVRLVGAQIEGQLVCRGGKFENPGKIALTAYMANVKGDVILDEGFEAKGEVKLIDAQIEGQLLCGGGRFENPGEIALSAGLASVKGSVFLNEGFEAKGEVWLVYAQIEGLLGCKGKFENPGRRALSADLASVKGGVYLRKGFEAKGEVSLAYAQIEGLLSCGGGKFENPDGNALRANVVSVRGDVFLDEGFEAKGEVRLVDAQIEGELSCRGGKFENPNGDAFSAVRMRVDQKLILRGATFKGTLNLSHARCGPLEDDKDSWPDKGKLKIDGFEYENFADAESVPRTAKERLEWLRLQPMDPFPSGTYDYLARVFKAMGREEDADEVMIGKQKDLVQHGRLSWSRRLWKRFLGWTIGYGYRSWLALGWILFLTIVGTCVFWVAYQQGLIGPSPEKIEMFNQFKSGRASYPSFYPWLYSVDLIIPILDLKQEAYWYPIVGARGGWLVFVYWLIHQLAGWVLWSLFITGVTGIIQRFQNPVR